MRSRALLASDPSAPRAQSPTSPRDRLIAALEAVISTGSIGHTDHDDGELLQQAVTAAIAGGDREIERLAARAASPLRAHLTKPVGSIASLPSIDINTQPALKVPRPIAYAAQIAVSLDGGTPIQLPEVRSGARHCWRVDTVIGAAAGAPGFHSLRLSVRLTFGDAAADAAATWTELREVPELTYAVYDPEAPLRSGVKDARSFLYGPGSVPARTFDPDLGEQPFAIWLTEVLSSRGYLKESPPEWLSHYCSERTGEGSSPPVPTAICAVMYFSAGGHLGQVWFRTGEVISSSAGVEWKLVTPPVFEGFHISESAPDSERLSRLPGVLDTDPAGRPAGDVTLSPDDIVLVPSAPKPGQPVEATVIVRNPGFGDLFKAIVHVAFATDLHEAGSARRFVVDIPARGSVSIKIKGVFPRGYGIVAVDAWQVSEHSPATVYTPDPTPSDGCAFRLVHLRAAPPHFVESLGDVGLCRGK